MEVVAVPKMTNGSTAGSHGVSSPFRNHDVREWSRMDSITGVLERARFETDHWTASTDNSSHKYGKVVDSRSRSNADGDVQQKARRQLEIFQSSVPGAHLQVIKTHTVSSSRWTNRTSEERRNNEPVQHFPDLELPVNPLDLSSQKSKASVGRSVGRRPPSLRPRPPHQHRSTEEKTIDHTTAAAVNLRRVSRLCHQIHEQAVRQTFGKYPRVPIQERESGDGVEIVELTSSSEERTSQHPSLTRTKSTSSEDLHLEGKSNKSIEDLEDLEQLQNWRRSSKIRRSLQLPKQQQQQQQQQKPSRPADLPENTGSVRKIRDDLETGRRLSTALRGNNVDLEALDQILQSISDSSSGSEKATPKKKRDSFVTVESLQEVKGRLRPTDHKKDEEIDDGIVTEEMPANGVRSYVYGLEKKPIGGTGSLESRSSKQPSNCRTEDWYNRRKSYGFEQVHNEEAVISKNKLIESSTDSGICRSSEITPKSDSVKTSPVLNTGNVKRFTSIFEQKRDTRSQPTTNHRSWNGFGDITGTTITIPIGKFENGDVKRHSIAVDESKYVTRTPADRTRRTSLVHDDSLEDDALQKRQKKVEFCKTEVHFAADSGRVNIVATDEKPPPTNNFRRRRRNSATMFDMNRNGLPMLHFGDTTYEKTMFAVSDQEDDNYEQPNDFTSTVTVSTNQQQNYVDADDAKEEELPKGILKNKPIKPKPYILGDENFFSNSDENIWGVKLKPVKSEAPMWRSTVTLKNTLYPNEAKDTEFNKFKSTLRPSRDDPREAKGYSTKVNIGGGEATVVEGSNRTWSLQDASPANHLHPNSSWDKTSPSRGPRSPVLLRRAHQEPVKDLRSAHDGEQLSSPFLVVQNVRNDTNAVKKGSTVRIGPATHSSPTRIQQRSPITKSPSPERRPVRLCRSKESSPLRSGSKESSPIRTTKEVGLSRSSPLKESCTRSNYAREVTLTRGNFKENQSTKESYETRNGPREGMKVQDSGITNSSLTAKTTRTATTKEAKESSMTIREKSPNSSVLRTPKKSEMAYFGVKTSPPPKATRKMAKPDLLQHYEERKPRQRSKSPVYENIDEVKTSQNVKQFDSSILDELTKAADQILQAVNGYAEEEEEKNRRTYRKEKLDTISETKSWRQTGKERPTQKSGDVAKAKLKHTSSTSSIESVTDKKCKQIIDDKKKSKEASTSKATTKARRLQRASSREALLQSRGSSSEDLPVMEVPRKPRIIRKTKTTQLTVTNGLDIKTKKTDEKKSEEKLKNEKNVGVLPEIRHKTAVSTIRSTAEKAASKERRLRNEEKKSAKREPFRTTSRRERPRNVTKEGAGQQTISTANIRKCVKSKA